ncbi:MAG: nucleotide exchange factor GrpE [Planctomycetaceae bacterium]
MSQPKKPKSSRSKPESSETAPEDAIFEEGSPVGDSRGSGDLEQQLQQAIAERDEYKDHWLRTQAELDNFRKRMRKEAEENQRYQALSLVRDLLPGLDNLERAIAAAEQSSNQEELIKGMRMVARQFEDVLARYAVNPILAVGEPFDPNLHEAVQQIMTDDHPPMTVMQEVERGFQLHDRVIRPSKVIVSAALPAPSPDDAN